MRKLTFFISIVTLFSVLFVSCKKGDKDPFLSLRSRQTRLVGIWQLQTMTHKITRAKSSDGVVSSTLDISYADSTKHSLSNTGDQTDSIYHETLTIEDNSSYTLLIQSKKAGRITFATKSYANQWYWLDAKKKKIGLMLNGYNSYDITRLASKELILTYYKTYPAANLEITESYEATYKKTN